MRAIRAVCIIQLVCALIAAVASNGCTSMRRAPVVAAAPQPLSWRVSPGDEVRVSMRNGQSAQFTVQTVESAAIIARDGTRYNLTDIVSVERRSLSGVKTTLLVVGIVCGALLLFVAAAQAALVGNI